MTTNNNRYQSTKNGVAILVTMIVVSVISTVGLSLSNVNLKQVNLATSSRDSELAVHAAEGALECMVGALRDVDLLDFVENNNNNLTNALPGPLTCLGETAAITTDRKANKPREVVEYKFEVDWEVDGRKLCSEAFVYVLNATDGEAVTYSFPGSFGLSSETCDVGDFCRVVFGLGYNQACGVEENRRTTYREFSSSF